MADDHGGAAQGTSNPLAAAQNPSVCVRVAEGCHVIGGKAHVAVELGSGDPVITGGPVVQGNRRSNDKKRGFIQNPVSGKAGLFPQNTGLLFLRIY